MINDHRLLPNDHRLLLRQVWGIQNRVVICPETKIAVCPLVVG